MINSGSVYLQTFQTANTLGGHQWWAPNYFNSSYYVVNYFLKSSLTT